MSKRVVIGCVLPSVTLIAIAIVGYAFLRNANYNSALDATKESARLLDFPANAIDVRVETTGNMFTREFTVTFVAPMDQINAWIRKSPGTKNVSPTLSGSVRRYSIEPGGGAQHAEVKVDEETDTVTISTYWS